MSRLRWRTFTMSTATRSVVVPNSAAWRVRYATFALHISFLLGMQLMFGHDPPIHWRSTTAVRWPDRARSQARSFPPCPLPSTSASYRSGAAIRSLQPKVVFKRQSFDGRVGTSVPAGLSISMNAESRLRSRVPVSAALKPRAHGIDNRRPTKELDQSAPAPQYMRCRGDRIRIREVRTVRFHW